MSDPVLVTRDLTKRYGEAAAVDHVNLRLDRGQIYGLIGKNGAGKTTLMRMVTGLSIPTSGAVELFGNADPTTQQEDRKRIGSLIESPGLHGAMTARENMRLHRVIRGIPSASAEDELLDLVGLGDTGHKRARDFSLGMRQRLGIAIALLPSPELLILDEPVNGLDPVGVVEMRLLLRQLSAERNITILISSHNLPELYQTATDYILIDQGAIRRTVTHGQLEAECRQYLRIACTEPERLLAVLHTELGTRNVTVMPDRSVRLYDHLDEPETVMRALCANGIFPTAFVTEGDTLEGYFLSVIGGDSRA
jgi:ABC-2 type transport system ATP-binding protein